MTTCTYSGDSKPCANAETLYASASIAFVTRREFYQWTNLVVVDFSSATSLKIIQSEAFSSCTNIENIILPPDLVEIGELAFFNCQKLASLTLPSALTTIGNRAFESCQVLSTLMHEPNIELTMVPSQCFMRTQIASFALWKSLETIQANAFRLGQLMTITNPEDNPNFQIIDGVLYKGTTLALCPSGWTGAIVIPAFVEAIADNCFSASRLSSVTFQPNSHFKTFGAAAFHFASSLSFFELPDSPDCTTLSTQMFHGCTSLYTLTLTAHIKQFGNSVFLGSTISTIIVPEDSEHLTSVDGVVYSKDLKTIWCLPPALIMDTYTIPKTVTTLAVSAFTGVTFPIYFEPGSQLSSIGVYTFHSYKCASFAFDVDCPLTNIPASAFNGADIEEIVLPRALQTLDGSAFAGTKIVAFSMPADAPYLTSMDGVLYSKDFTTLFRFPPLKSGGYRVPAAVVRIGRNAFNACSGINELVFEGMSNFTTLQYRAFISSSITRITFPQNGQTVVFETQCFTSSSVQSITLPGQMRVIQKDLFKDCTNLVEIKLPECITAIGSNAFLNCESLTNLVIPQFAQLASISDDAFKGATKLASLKLPYRVTTISKMALPPKLQHVTLYCPPSESIVQALEPLASLETIEILCNHEIDTSNFASENPITVTHLCNSRRLLIFRKVVLACFLFTKSIVLLAY